MSLRIVLKCDTYICESDLWLSFDSYKETLSFLLEEGRAKGWAIQGPAHAMKIQCPRHKDQA